MMGPPSLIYRLNKRCDVYISSTHAVMGFDKTPSPTHLPCPSKHRPNVDLMLVHAGPHLINVGSTTCVCCVQAGFPPGGVRTPPPPHSAPQGGLYSPLVGKKN